MYDTAAQIVISLEYRNQDMAFGQQQLLDRINSLSKTANNRQPISQQGITGQIIWEKNLV